MPIYTFQWKRHRQRRRRRKRARTRSFPSLPWQSAAISIVVWPWRTSTNSSPTEATVLSSRNRRGRTTSVTSAHITNSSSKAHGSPCTGAGYYWSIHPVCLGNFSIKKARHAVQQFQMMEKLDRVYQQQRQLLQQQRQQQQPLLTPTKTGLETSGPRGNMADTMNSQELDWLLLLYYVILKG